MELLISLCVSLFLYSCVVILSFSIFRVRILENRNRIIVLGVSLGLINFFVKSLLQTPIFSLIVLISFICLITVTNKYPVFYSFVFCTISFFIYAGLDAIVVFFTLVLGSPNSGTATDPESQNVFMSLLLCGIYLAVSALLRKFDVGFSFIIKRFSNKQILKSHNFMWGGILMSGVVIFQFIVFKTEILSLNGTILLILLFVFLFNFCYSYVENKKSVKIRYPK